MPNMLSFPSYVPKSDLLRRYLLFYDHVATIVPHEDQHKVEQREHVAAMQEVSDGAALSFIDPTYRYSEWFFQETSMARFEQLARIQRDEYASRNLLRNVTIDSDGYLRRDDATDGAENFLQSIGWTYLATAKFPPEMLDKLFEQKLAFRAREIIHEENPILIDPRLGDFVLSRLAREIATSHDLAPVASKRFHVSDFMLDGAISKRERRAKIMAVVLDVAVPDEISHVPIGDFWHIRRQYEPVRALLNNLAQELSVQMGLDDETEASRFNEKIKDFSSDFGDRLNKVHGKIQRKQQTLFAIDLFTALAGAGLGFMGLGPAGALVGAAVLPVVSHLGGSISLSSDPHDLEGVKQLALMRSEMQRKARQFSYRQPYYGV